MEVKELEIWVQRLLVERAKQQASEARAIRKELAAVDRRHTDRENSIEKTLVAALKSLEDASNKLARASEKRFESVNEFRQVLTDQTATLITRNECIPRFEAIEKNISDIQIWQSKQVGVATQSDKFDASIMWSVGIFLTVVFSIASLIVSILK